MIGIIFKQEGYKFEKKVLVKGEDLKINMPSIGQKVSFDGGRTVLVVVDSIYLYDNTKQELKDVIVKLSIPNI